MTVDRHPLEGAGGGKANQGFERDDLPGPVREPALPSVSEEQEHEESRNGPVDKTEEPKRKVSIVSDPVMDERQRKISSSSGRYKGILVHGEFYSQAYDTNRPVYNVEEKADKQSLGYESIHTQEDGIENSWWYLLCTKCRQKESGLGWEPGYWQRACPYPFCPTYRHVARIFALVLLVLLAWGVIYSIMGPDAAPGGQLFDIAVLCIAANFGGWLFRMVTMPPLVGMLLVGILFQNIGLVNIHDVYDDVVSVLRRIALVVILTRAGLDLDSAAMKRLCWTVLKMGLVPWIIECLIVTILSHYFMGLPWMWGVLLGSIVAAVSPAVVVPCLIRLRNKGYGVAKGIPTLIIAVSGIDDASSVAAFGIIHSIMFLSNSLAYEILLGPLSIVIGIVFGLIWGVLANYVPEKQDPFVVPLRILLLLGGGLISVFGSEVVELGGAGPLGCIAAAFLSCYAWSKQGWDVEDNPVATAFEIFWMIFEPILFGLTGTQIKINEMEPNTVGIGASILVAGILIRIVITCFVAIGACLNIKEKIFCSLAWMSKASVQAALGPVALDLVRDGGRSQDEINYARIVLMVCVMSILMTAPVGAILITVTGSKLLTKLSSTASLAPPTGWRRSARPSLRDISIIDGDDEYPSSRKTSVVDPKPPPVSQLTLQPPNAMP